MLASTATHTVTWEKLPRQRAEQATREAVPRLLQMGPNVEQVAQALGLPVEEVRRYNGCNR